MIQVFLVCLKKTTHKPSNVEASKNFFSSVYIIGTTCFDKGFLFRVISGRQYFLKQAYHYFAGFLLCDFVTFFETSILEEVRILRPLS